SDFKCPRLFATNIFHVRINCFNRYLISCQCHLKWFGDTWSLDFDNDFGTFFASDFFNSFIKIETRGALPVNAFNLIIWAQPLFFCRGVLDWSNNGYISTNHTDLRAYALTG